MNISENIISPKLKKGKRGRSPLSKKYSNYLKSNNKQTKPIDKSKNIKDLDNIQIKLIKKNTTLFLLSTTNFWKSFSLKIALSTVFLVKE